MKSYTRLILAVFILMVNTVGILFADGRDTTVSLKDDISSTISGKSNWQKINISNGIQGNNTETNKDDYLRNTREAPANDNCENAEFLGSPYPVHGFGTCVDATVNCPGYLDWIGVWYEIELPYADNNIEITLCANGLYTTSTILMNDCNCDDYVAHDNGSWITCGNGDTGYYQEWLNISGPGTILWPVLAKDSSDNNLDFSYEINVSTDDSTPWLNIRNSSYTSDNHIHLRTNIENPDYADNTTFYYLSGNSWVSSALSNPFGNTYDAEAPINPNTNFYCRYKSQPTDSPIEMMTAFLPNDNFPPDLSELSFVQNDSVGDNVGGTDSNMDITEEYIGFSDNRIFGAMRNASGSYPTNDGYPYDDYFIYAIGFKNPASAYSDSVSYALVYCDIPTYNDYGLFRIINDDFTEIGDISYNISGDYLKMAGNFADLLSDPYFGPWNNDDNDRLELQSHTILAADYGDYIIYADDTDYSKQLVHNYIIEPHTNILPEIVNYSYIQNGSSTNFTATYSDANFNFPTTTELELTNPRTGIREIYQLEPNTTDYSAPVVFSANVNCQTWENGLFRFSDNGSDYVTQVFMGPEEIFVEDFEYGTGNWTLDPRWGLTTSTYQSSDHCLCNPRMGGLYSDNENSTATLNPFDFSACSNISVSFYETHDLEENGDFVYLEVSTGGGWNTIASFTGLDSPWTKRTYSLSAYEGLSNVQIRFRLETNSIFSYNGFFVDDFIINADGTPPFGTISGQVTEEDGVTPVVGATVMAGNYGATTNSLGLYTINNVSPGSYDIVCGDTLHYSLIEYNQQVYEGVTTTVDFSLEEVLRAENPAYLVLDGTGDYVDCGEGGGDFDITSAITLECFFMIDHDGWSNSYEALITKGDHTWRIARAGDSEHIEFACQNLTPNFYVTSNLNFVPEVWYHVAGVYDGSSLKIYVNGVLDNSVSAGGSIGTDNNPVYIGENYDYSRDFGGNIDEVRVWNSALSQTTIQNWMYDEITPSHPNYANLVSLWEMNDYETPAVAHDSKGNNDGTIINAVYEHITASPVFHLNPGSLDFGDVIVDDSEILQFTITNNGSGTLSGTITTPADYSVAEVRDIVSKEKDNLHRSRECNKTSNLRNELSYSITTSQTFNLTFAPTEILNYDGNVVITSNDPNNSTNNLAVYGNGIGLDSPVVTITEDGVNVTLSWNAVSGATSYTVYSDTDPYGSFSTVEQAGITSTTWGEPLSGNLKFYRVTATNVTRTESASSDILGFIKYECIQTAGTDLNFIALPLDAGYTNASDLGDDIGDCDAISKWDANNQAWVQASKLPFGWAGDFALTDGNAYMINVTNNVDIYIDGPMLSLQPTFNLVTTAGTDLNFLMLRLDKSDLNLASLLGDDIGVCDAVSNWNAANQAWVQASKLPFGWASDYSIQIGDPLMVNVTANTTWPAARSRITKKTGKKIDLYN